MPVQGLREVDAAAATSPLRYIVKVLPTESIDTATWFQMLGTTRPPRIETEDWEACSMASLSMRATRWPSGSSSTQKLLRVVHA